MKPSTRILRSTTLAATLAVLAGATVAGPLDKTECIAPAKPGGGFDLTCKLAQAALAEGKFIRDPMRVTYMPGGIGAVAYNTIVAQRPEAANTIVAFSGGSLLNLAQGKFGRYGENDVRWLAAIGADYGAVVVSEKSPYKSLQEVLAAMKADPTKVVFGAGGSVGSQDWMKAALLAKAAGVNPKVMRFVAFEGGGEAMTALQGGHIHVFTGDAAETLHQMKAGSKVRVLAVMSDKRLPGDLSAVPTAKEQGADIDWPTVRGFYVGPKVSDADYKTWSDTFARMMATPAYAKQREQQGLYPLSLTGAEAEAHVKKQVAAYRKLVEELGLTVAPAAAK
ncbi:Bug family tripartite tricarboxylate transporter substrate binding protein [Azohydromonas aeria]|uniref:Bug family tripartite tricarboxylate transporter substrate binding protein n=1 Tax=Azohydromonas aeria TaxID=2590212 RepID=UPI0012FCD69E|nr:tripartite tricarboxylate transporter substrate-binding protein [Azohydromonas aeria]